MNDTHDSQGGGYSAEMFAANDFKQANPQYLLATSETRPRYGVLVGGRLRGAGDP